MALAGSNLAVTCSADSTTDVCWEYYPQHSSIPRTISAGLQVNRQYTASHRVTISDRDVTLTVLSAQFRDAGIYQCRECATVNFADIEVTVLGTESAICHLDN